MEKEERKTYVIARAAEGLRDGEEGGEVADEDAVQESDDQE